MSRFWASLAAFGVVGGGGIAFFMRRSSAAPPPPSKDDFVFFRPESTNDRISEALKTGDLLLFQRGMPERFSARSVFTFLTRGVANSAWDHVGVVVRDRDPKNNVPYVLEAGPSGVQVCAALNNNPTFALATLHLIAAVQFLSPLQFHAFDERVLKSQSAVIALRRLMLAPDISRDLIAMEIAQREFREQRFRISPLPLVMSFLLGPNRGDHVKNATRLQSLNREIEDLEHQFGATPSPAAESAAVADPDAAKRCAAALHVLDKRRAERDALDKKLEAVSQGDSDSALLPAMGDVDLVVNFYQELGIFPPFPRAHHYAHRDFVSELGGRVPMVPPATLSTEVYIKT